MEIWKDVIDFEGIYQVSNFGNVRSTTTHKLKKITIGKDKRLYLGLWKNNKQKIFKPHKLVLEAFVGKAPQGMECCHNDGNQTNNNLENLRWDTPKNNHADKLKHGTSNTGENCNWAKLTKEQVIAIRQDIRTQKEIAAEYGVQQSQISRIKNSTRWKHY
jgi:hypothetical protein